MTEQTAPKRRPFGVTIVIILQLLSIIVLVTDFSILEWVNDTIGNQTGQLIVLIQQGVGNTYLSLVIIVAVLLFVAVTTLGLWLLQRWAWLLIMIQLGVTMGGSLWLYFNGNRLYISMLINVVMVFYLNQHEVQQAFEHKAKTEETIWTT